MRLNNISNQNFQGRCRVFDPAIRALIKTHAPQKNAEIFSDEIKGLVKYIKHKSAMLDSYEIGFSRPLQNKKSDDYFYNIFLRRKHLRCGTVGPIPLMPAKEGKAFNYDKASQTLRESIRTLKYKFDNVDHFIKKVPIV